MSTRYLPLQASNGSVLIPVGATESQNTLATFCYLIANYTTFHISCTTALQVNTSVQCKCLHLIRQHYQAGECTHKLVADVPVVVVSN